MKHAYFISVGLKIFAICLVMLSFLVVVAVGNYFRMVIVKQEVKDVAEFIAPISKNVNQIYILSLEQEVLFERTLRLSETKKRQQEEIDLTYQHLIQLNSEVNQLLDATISRANTATDISEIRADIVAFARLFPELRMLGEDHKMFHQLSLDTLKAMRNKGSHEG